MWVGKGSSTAMVAGVGMRSDLEEGLIYLLRTAEFHLCLMETTLASVLREACGCEAAFLFERIIDRHPVTVAHGAVT